jgi:ABC-2 type transport system ATP-binding protein
MSKDIKLQVSDLAKTTSKASLMDEINLTVHAGEIFALVGDSGSGKSLLTKIILNLSIKSSGKVQINPKRMGSVIEYQTFRTEKTGYGTLRFYSDINLKNVTNARFKNIMNLLGLKRIMHNAVATYTDSQVQRLKIACALLTKPEMLVLDMPFVGLSREEARAVRVILRSLAKNLSTAIFITSVDFTDVEEICDTFAVIDDGMIVTIKSYNAMVEDDAVQSKISVMTEVPNLTAKVITENLKFRTALCGTHVIVDAPESEAKDIAELLGHEGIKILAMQRVNRPLNELYRDVIRKKRGNA